MFGKIFKSFFWGAVGMLVAIPATASLRIDVKNDSSEDCSLAFNVRTDKTKWITSGWYVFASGEEAPVLLDDVSDVRNVYVYNDCVRPLPQGTETRKVWVKTNLKFRDEMPRDGEKGYEEVTFFRLNGNKYNITD